ncbi:hypothetical protein [Paenibacillus eucommiae]|uniref:Uncharacterized protein n=1 Tax=Paenibacillus eucommiae TaxID=1355755 RepID=A0ABS4IQ77_9BACL|nr:hypothetical protein [Paenibacillus eucommiae]MBP1989723.1 hypothetical protein [Paenibacillus eucommiae]
MKIIVKVAAPSQLRVLQSQRSWPAGKSPPIQRKTLHGCSFKLAVHLSCIPFERGVCTIRAIVAEREHGFGWKSGGVRI